MEIRKSKTGYIPLIVLSIALLMFTNSAYAYDGSVSYPPDTENFEISINEERTIPIIVANNGTEPLVASLTQNGLGNIQTEFPENIMLNSGENKPIDIVLSSTEPTVFDGKINVRFLDPDSLEENDSLVLGSSIPISGKFIAENIPIKPKFTYEPSNPEPNQKVVFDASESLGIGVNLKRFDWTFGDNRIGNGETVEHVYEKEGTYKVTLTVQDEEGNMVSISKDITIKEKSLIGRGTSFLILTFLTLITLLILVIWRRTKSEKQTPLRNGIQIHKKF